MALVRAILEFAETKVDKANPKTFGRSRHQWGEATGDDHVDLCLQAGLITRQEERGGRLLTGLTWAGHDLLARFRDNPEPPFRFLDRGLDSYVLGGISWLSC